MAIYVLIGVVANTQALVLGLVVGTPATLVAAVGWLLAGQHRNRYRARLLAARSKTMLEQRETAQETDRRATRHHKIRERNRRVSALYYDGT